MAIGQVEVQWRQTKHRFPCPVMVGGANLTDPQFKKAFESACHKGKLDRAIKRCADEHHKSKLVALKEALAPTLRELIRRGANTFEPFELKRFCDAEDPAGVCGIAKNATGTVIKHGMAFDCFFRVVDAVCGQTHVFAFKLKDRKELRRLIPQAIIQPIEDLLLPGMLHHADHIERTRDLICMLICEGLLAITHTGTECVTNTMFERFVQDPPRLDLTPIRSMEERAERFLQDLTNEDCQIHGMTTWPTTKSTVLNIAKTSFVECIGTRIREAPEDGFLTLHLIRMVLGRQKLEGWEDVVKTPPRQRTPDDFAAKIKGLLDRGPGENPSEDARKTAIIEEALATITGENKESCVHPAEEELAEGFITAFERLDREKPRNMCFCVEKFTPKAVQSKRSAWFQALLREADVLRVSSDVPDLGSTSRLDLLFVKLQNGRRLIVTASFFQAFAPKAQMDVRLHAIKTMIALLQLLGQVGVHSPDHVESCRNVLRSCCMALTFNEVATTRAFDGVDEREEGSRVSAARWALPAGYLKGPLPNNLAVSDNIGTGANVHDFHCIMFRLEEQDKSKVRNLFHCLGMLGAGMDQPQETCPADVNWKCTGTPKTPNFAAQPCPNAAENPMACFVGKKHGKENYEHWGIWVCRDCCWRKMERRELDVLRTLESAGADLPEHQAKLLRTLENRTTTQSRKRRMEKRGADNVNRQEREQQRARGKTPDQVAAKARSNRERDRGRDDKKSGEIRKAKSNAACSPNLARLLERGVILLTRKMGSRRSGIWWGNFRTLFLEIMQRTCRDHSEITLDGLTPTGRVKHQKQPFLDIVARHLYLDPQRRDWWKVKATSEALMFQGVVGIGGKPDDIVMMEAADEVCGEEGDQQGSKTVA